MKPYSLVLALLSLASTLRAQYVYTIKADSVKITNNCDTAELILENHTQNILGFLYNKGKGRTEFRKAIKLNDSTLIFGEDTLLIRGTNTSASNGLTAVNNNVMLGQSVGQAGNPAALTSVREIPLNGHSISFKTSSNRRFYVGQEGYLSTPSWHSSDYITWFADSNLHIFQGVGLGYDNWPILHLVNHIGTVNTRYSGVIAGYKSGGSTGKGDLLITTYASSGTGSELYGDIIIRPGTNRVFDNTFVNQYGNNSIILQPAGTGSLRTTKKSYFGANTSPTALVHVAAGLSAAGNAPMKFTAGTLLTTPEDGAVEYDGADLYLTQNSTRYKLAKTLNSQLSTNFGGPALAAFSAVTTTLSVPGVLPGDVVTVSSNSGAVNPASIIITAYVTTANTVTLQAYNASNSTINVAADTYRVRIVQ